VTKILSKTQNKFWMSLCAIAFLIAMLGDAYAATKIQEAYLHYQAHRFKEATAAFDEYLVSNPRDANALYYDALCNQQIGNMPRAKSLYRLVVQASPGSQVANYAESILVKVDPSYHASSTSSAPQTSQQTSAATSVSSAPSASSSIQGPDQASVYYRPNGKQMMISVEINGHPVEMMLDTGAPGICIGRGELENIGVHPPDGSPTGATGGSSNDIRIGTWHMKSTIKVGPFIDRNADVMVMQSTGSNALLGQTFIKNFEYQVDQSAHRILFTKKGSTSASQGQGYTLPFTFREQGNRIIVDGEIGGRKSKFMMDTGNSGSGIAFHSPEQAAQYGAPVPEGATVSSFSGVSGSGTAYVYTISHLRIGPIDCTDLDVAAHNGSGFGGEEPLLGHKVFEGWQYTVDYDKKVIHLMRR
jgi:predicted aspartyl protease